MFITVILFETFGWQIYLHAIFKSPRKFLLYNSSEQGEGRICIPSDGVADKNVGGEMSWLNDNIMAVLITAGVVVAWFVIMLTVIM